MPLSDRVVVMSSRRAASPHRDRRSAALGAHTRSEARFVEHVELPAAFPGAGGAVGDVSGQRIICARATARRVALGPGRARIGRTARVRRRTRRVPSAAVPLSRITGKIQCGDVVARAASPMATTCAASRLAHEPVADVPIAVANSAVLLVPATHSRSRCSPHDRVADPLPLRLQDRLRRHAL